ncbi:hypothetical protein ACFHWD_03100 [Clostridium sp. MT-14]|uniref:hypothetical protein n=1 Tax=Clostridium sp. MT-14 TaxID=3348360 RepID=UPI0035F3A642
MSFYLNPNIGADNYHSIFLTTLNKMKVNKNIIIYKLGFQPRSSGISVSARIYDSSSIFDKPVILLKDVEYYIGEYGTNIKMYDSSITQLQDDRITLDFLSGGCFSPGDSFPISKQSYYTTFSGLKENISFNYDLVNKYLIKQQGKYYVIKDGSPIELGIPTDDVQLEQWFYDYGIDDINDLCTKYNIEKYTSSGETLGNGKLFTFNVPNNMKNINNVN